MMIRTSILGVIMLAWWLSGCDTETEFVGFTGAEYQRLLTADSVKVWKKQSEKRNGELLESDECQDLTLIEFGYVGNDPEARYFVIKLDPNACERDSIMQSGSWMLLLNSEERTLADTILFTTGSNSTLKWIGEITALRMELRSSQNGEELIESYTFEEGL